MEKNDSEESGGRFLTDEEKAELASLANRPQGSLWLLAGLCWVLTVADLVFLLTVEIEAVRLGSFVLLLIATIATTVRSRQVTVQKRQMLCDVDLGTLVKDRSDGSDIEHLPVSSLLWTVDGQPAPWRQSIRKRN
jgi:hypothetical protein